MYGSIYGSGIEYRYFSRYRMEVGNSSIVATLLYLPLNKAFPHHYYVERSINVQITLIQWQVWYFWEINTHWRAH